MPCAVIVDRDPELRRRLAGEVRRYLDRQGQTWQVEVLSSCRELRSFCDLAVIPADEGLKSARRLRKKDVRVAIILLADTEEYVFQGYDLSVCAYLLRPVDQKLLESGLLNALRQLSMFQTYIDLPVAGGLRREDICSICYVKGDRKGSRVFTLHGSYSVLSPLGRLCLPEYFVPCNGKWINPAHITQINRETICFHKLTLFVDQKEREQIITHILGADRPFMGK